MSLPIKKIDDMRTFLDVMQELRRRGIDKLILSKEFQEYSNFFEDKNLRHFLGLDLDEPLRKKILTFLTKGTKLSSIPVISVPEPTSFDVLEGVISDHLLELYSRRKYYYNQKIYNGEILWGDIYGTLIVSFCSKKEWEEHKILLQREEFSCIEDIEIPNIAKASHFDEHKNFFKELVEHKATKIKKNNFWDNRKQYFKNIEFCNEVKDNVKKISNKVFFQAIRLLLKFEHGLIKYEDIEWHPESRSVNSNPKMSKQRSYTKECGATIYIEEHHNLHKGHRIYCKKDDNILFVGYIGHHMQTKKY